MSEKTTKELVLEGRDEGKVVFLQFDGDGVAVLSAPVAEFINQPADGILYDLNRLEEIALTYMDDPKWVNDFAVALTIRELKEQRGALLAVVSVLEEIKNYAEGADRAIDEAGEAYIGERNFVNKIEEMAYQALAALPEHLTHEHEFVDATNEIVQGGYVCLGCGEIRAELPEHLKEGS